MPQLVNRSIESCAYMSSLYTDVSKIGIVVQHENIAQLIAAGAQDSHRQIIHNIGTADTFTL